MFFSHELSEVSVISVRDKNGSKHWLSEGTESRRELWAS